MANRRDGRALPGWSAVFHLDPRARAEIEGAPAGDDSDADDETREQEGAPPTHGEETLQDLPRAELSAIDDGDRTLLDGDLVASARLRELRGLPPLEAPPPSPQLIE